MAKGDLELGVSTATDSTRMKKHAADNRMLALVACFLGLQVSYVTWGYLQERVMTQEYKSGKFSSSAFLVFENRVFALLLALIIVMYNRYNSKTSHGDAPLYAYIPSSLSNSISSWSQYEALKYVSFPSQVLSKSCKIIPVMLVGILVNHRSYPLVEYVEALLISSGATVFTLFGSSAHGAERTDSYVGIGLLLSYLFCDSFTSQWQSRVYKKHGIDQYQMMLGVNFWSIVLTGISLVQSGEGLESIAFILADSLAMYHMALLAIASAVGQLFIFYTIKEFGPVIFTIMMTTRQILSLILSCIVFSHPLNAASWAASALVFGVVINRIKRKGSE